MKSNLLLVLITCVAAFSFLISVPAEAALWSFDSIALDGTQEVPAVVTTGTGTATATLDDVTGEINITGSFADLIGQTTASHLHGPALVGQNAGVMSGLIIDLDVTAGNFSGNDTLGGGDVASVLAGNSYINVHTTFKPGGEIRGQLLNPTLVPEPASIGLATFALVGGFLLRRKR